MEQSNAIWKCLVETTSNQWRKFIALCTTEQLRIHLNIRWPNFKFFSFKYNTIQNMFNLVPTKRQAPIQNMFNLVPTIRQATTFQTINLYLHYSKHNTIHFTNLIVDVKNALLDLFIDFLCCVYESFLNIRSCFSWCLHKDEAMFTSKCFTLFLLYLPPWLQITAKI